MTAETTTILMIDRSEIRPAAAAAAASAPRRAAVLMVAVGIIGAAGIGFGAWSVFDRLGKPRVSSVRMGPLVDMPEIRDGVPALATVRSNPAAMTVPEPRRAAAGSDGEPRNVRTVSAPLPPASVADIESANAKAMALTVASVQLRPGFGTQATAEPPPQAFEPTGPDGVRHGDPARSVALERPRAAMVVEPSANPANRSGVDARMPVSAAPTAGAAADDVPAALVVSPPVASPPVAPSPRESSAAPPGSGSRPATPPNAAPATARAAPPPLPPARPAARPASPEQVATAQRPRLPGSGSSPVNAPPTPAQPEPERAEIFGLPLPGFVPTGRQIREAAGNLADAVVTLPDRF